MSALAPQVSKFVAACEALHWALLQGHSLPIEDRDVIRQTAVQLLMRVDTPSGKVWKRFDEQIEQDPHP